MSGVPGSALRVADLPPASYPDAVGVLARGMRDNPLHVAAYGADPTSRAATAWSARRGPWA